MTADKIQKIVISRTKKLPEHFHYIVNKFKMKNKLKKYLWGISYRTSITIPNDDEIDLDIHPLFKSKQITDMEKIKFTMLFLKSSIDSVNKLKLPNQLLKIFLNNIHNSNSRPFDLKICFSWDKKTLKPTRYTLYTNYNSQKNSLNLFNKILPKKIIKKLINTNSLIDTIAIDIFNNNKRNYKIYYRKKIKDYFKNNIFKSKITSLYVMKAFPNSREKTYIHFSNSINPKFFLKYIFNKKSYNYIMKWLKIPKHIKVYFIGYTEKPEKKVTLYLR